VWRPINVPALQEQVLPIKMERLESTRVVISTTSVQTCYSMALDMAHPRAIEVARKLIAQADIVMENFVPGVMEKWGLGYEELKKVKSDIIMVRQSGFGAVGPYAHLPAFGTILAAIAGLPNFIGWPDRGPLPTGVGPYTDCISPRFASAALMAALDYRNRTGKGQLLDLSQFETATYFILPAILDYVVNGREPLQMGNSSTYAVPHGVYPCKGKERWCTIVLPMMTSGLSYARSSVSLNT